MERAKLMVSGQYDDVKIIKVKFDIKDKEIFGLLIVFINIPGQIHYAHRFFYTGK